MTISLGCKIHRNIMQSRNTQKYNTKYKYIEIQWKVQRKRKIQRNTFKTLWDYTNNDANF